MFAPENMSMENVCRLSVNPLDDGGELILVGISTEGYLVQPVVLTDLIVKQDEEGYYATFPCWYSSDNCGIVYVPTTETRLSAATKWLHHVLDIPEDEKLN
jgi:hypothetical protein